MKKIFVLLTVFIFLTAFSSCTVGGLIEADQLEGTWVSDSSYNSNTGTYYCYYDFDPDSVEFGGDQNGQYRIRGYFDTFWGDNNYESFEEGYYTTDYIRSEMTLMPDSGVIRILDYTISDNLLTFSDSSWWSSNAIILKKY